LGRSATIKYLQIVFTVKPRSRQFSFIIGSFLASWLFIVSACWSSSELPGSNLPSNPSPILSTSIAAYTSTSVPTSSPTSTPTVVTQQPTLTSIPTEVAIFPSPPTVTRIANAESDAEHLEQIFSGGMGYIILSPKIADMLLTDAQGRRLGYYAASGKDVNEFFDKETNYSTYSRYEGTAKDLRDTIILLPLQAWGSTITITLTGIEGGQYTLLATFSNENNLHSAPIFAYPGVIRRGEIVTQTINVPKEP
jgi:hypothetical protein